MGTCLEPRWRFSRTAWALLSRLANRVAAKSAAAPGWPETAGYGGNATRRGAFSKCLGTVNTRPQIGASLVTLTGPKVMEKALNGESGRGLKRKGRGEAMQGYEGETRFFSAGSSASFAGQRANVRRIFGRCGLHGPWIGQRRRRGDRAWRQFHHRRRGRQRRQ